MKKVNSKDAARLHTTLADFSLMEIIEAAALQALFRKEHAVVNKLRLLLEEIREEQNANCLL